MHTHSLADVLDRDRVGRRPDRHQSVVRNPARFHLLVMIGRSRSQWCELFMGEPLARPLVRGAMNTPAGGLGAPAFEPTVEVIPRSEPPPGQRVALYILDAVLDLAFGARPIGWQARGVKP